MMVLASAPCSLRYAYSTPRASSAHAIPLILERTGLPPSEAVLSQICWRDFMAQEEHHELKSAAADSELLQLAAHAPVSVPAGELSQ